MSSVVLAALIGKSASGVRAPSMIRAYDYTFKGEGGAGITSQAPAPIVPDKMIGRFARPMLKSLLEAPLCYEAFGQSHGTLKAVSNWCARRRNDVRLHFAKTGTQVTADPDATVDAWITGGIQFANGAAYSYVVVVGTGSASQPWARSMHAAQIAPLLDTLLQDLSGHAKEHPRRDLLPRPAVKPLASRPHTSAGTALEMATPAALTRPRAGTMTAGEQALRSFIAN
jgi:hypothetical protein